MNNIIKKKIIIDLTPLVSAQSGIAHDLINILNCLNDLNLYEIEGYLKSYNGIKDLEKLKVVLNSHKLDINKIIFIKANKIIDKIKPLLGMYSATIENEKYSFLFSQVDTNLKTNKATKIFLRLHDVIVLTHPRLVNNSFINQLIFKGLINNSLKQNVHYIFNSDFSHREFLKHFYVKELKYSVIWAIAETNSKIERTDLIPKEKYITFCGSIEPKKNLKILINAFNLCLTKIPDLKLVIIGRYGWNSSWFLKEISNYKNVIWFNNTNDSQRDSLIHFSSCFVFPSIIEGFGAPPIEAMRLNVPVVVSDIEVFNELHGNNSLKAKTFDFTDLSEKILFTLDSKNLGYIKNLTKNAFEWSNRYSKEEIYKKWKEVLN